MNMIKLEELKEGIVLVAKGIGDKRKVLGVCGSAVFLTLRGSLKEAAGAYFTIEEINKDYTLELPDLPKAGDVIIVRVDGNSYMRVATGNVTGSGEVRFFTVEKLPGLGGKAEKWEFYEPNGSVL